MRRNRIPVTRVPAILTLMMPVLAQAAATGYTDRAAFDTAVATLGGVSTNADYDAHADGTILPSGAEDDGVVYSYAFGGVQIEVRAVEDVSQIDTTSTPNYAGTTDAGVFQDNDNVTFSTVSGPGFNAVGLSVTTTDTMEPGDIVLTANGASVGLNPIAVQSILEDGASEYFLGVVDAVAFSNVQLTTAGGGFFLFTIDDLVHAKAPDSDGDGVADAGDNCTLIGNDQLDTDGDNIGNACDPDIAPTPNNCRVDFNDLSALRLAFFSTPGASNWNPDADLTGDGRVNFNDLNRMKSLFFMAPGPSGLPNPCSTSSL